MSNERARDVPLQIPQLRERMYAGPIELARGLAERVATERSVALKARGRALLAVSGGSTPKRFFAELAQADIDWARVEITLADERFVPEDDERSNARLLREHLLVGRAKAARLLPLWLHGHDAETAALAHAHEFEARLPFDVLVLGMGADGHTASLFPGGDNLAHALDPACPRPLLSMHAPGASEPRITFTLPALVSAKHLHLHIEGAAKQTVLREALARGELPIAKVLAAYAEPCDVWTCP
jgi:6-phosphogluconolactonase